MAIYRVQVAIPRVSGLPEDVAVNTFHFRRGTTAEGAFLDVVQARLKAFYEALKAADIYSNQVNLPGATWKAYDLADAEPRVPVRDASVDMLGGMPTGDPLPSEVAIVVSWKGEALEGVPRGRTRGRTYLGPLNRAVQKLGDRDHIDTTYLDAISDAAQAFAAPFAGDAEEGLVVYSHTGAIASQVVGGWVDDAYDIQRRRGRKATTRFEFDAV